MFKSGSYSLTCIWLLYLIHLLQSGKLPHSTSSSIPLTCRENKAKQKPGSVIIEKSCVLEWANDGLARSFKTVSVSV